MKREKKIVLVVHCILNVNAKVEGIAPSKAGVEELVIGLMRQGYGIIQLPCVEQDMCGIRRWGQVKEQLDHPNFRQRCHTLLMPILNQVDDFIQNGYSVCGIVGLDGSPSCGVELTCSGEWYGEIGEGFHVLEKANTLQMVPKSGVMMDVLKSMLKERNITIPFLAVDEANPEKSVQDILTRIVKVENNN